MTHRELAMVVETTLPTEELGTFVAACLITDISRTLADLPRGERVLALVRLQQHLSGLVALGPDRCADPDRMAQLLGINRR